jgi:hypothetical protein
MDREREKEKFRKKEIQIKRETDRQTENKD